MSFVRLLGRIRVNRAIDGDVVAVQIVSGDLTDEEAATEAELARLERFEGGAGPADSDGAIVGDETAEASPEGIEGIEEPSALKTASTTQGAGIKSSTGEAAPLCGKVVGIIRRNWRQYAGSLDSLGTGDKAADAGTDRGGDGGDLGAGAGAGGDDSSLSMLFFPVEKRLPAVRICTRRRQQLLDKRLLVALDNWPADSAHPLGHYVRVLGVNGDKSVETQVGNRHSIASLDLSICHFLALTTNRNR
jgi:exosome complex exonuclease DIS3/RRP44